MFDAHLTYKGWYIRACNCNHKLWEYNFEGKNTFSNNWKWGKPVS